MLTASSSSVPLLQVEHLMVRYPSHGQNFTAAVALVGESGCGKSTTALAMMGLLPPTAAVSGKIVLGGRNISDASDRELRQLRGNHVAMIFQEPMTSLNPTHRIGDQIIEALREHRDLSHRLARARAIELLDLVNLADPSRRVDDFPHQLSGGQRQRVMIAMAIACEPDLLIADEPTAALDATIQAQILQLLHELRHDLSMSLLLISHDLEVVSHWTDRVLVMHHGEVMEEIPARSLLRAGAHPYTRGLIEASVSLDDRLHYTIKPLTEIRTTVDEQGQYSFQTVTPKAAMAQPPSAAPDRILEVKNLSIDYEAQGRRVHAVENVSFRIDQGETLALVGESGSGKSTVSKAVMRLLPSREGSIFLEGHDITHLKGKALQRARHRMQMIFQDPYGSLNPRQPVGTVLERVLHLHGVTSAEERRRRVNEVIDAVGLRRSVLDRYPHEFSGGQRQRIAIARALILRPQLLICDEPVSALDVSVQAQILNLLVELKATFGLSYLFISHDLAVVQYISDRVIVMKSGQIVEEGDYLDIWKQPKHDYTRALIAAVTATPLAGADIKPHSMLDSVS